METMQTCIGVEGLVLFRLLVDREGLVLKQSLEALVLQQGACRLSGLLARRRRPPVLAPSVPSISRAARSAFTCALAQARQHLHTKLGAAQSSEKLKHQSCSTNAKTSNSLSVRTGSSARIACSADSS